MDAATSLSLMRPFRACVRIIANASSIAEVEPLRHDTFRLLDDDPRVEGRLELPGQLSPVVDGPFLENPDGGGVGERLREIHLLGGQLAKLRIEYVHRADRVVAQPKRERMNHLETRGPYLGGESRPPGVGLIKALVDDRLPASERVAARSSSL